MTELEPLATTKAVADPWAATFDGLRRRFPRVRDTVLLCVHVLEQGEDATLEVLQARAALHGLHVTGASLNAARRLLRPPVRLPEPRRQPHEAAEQRSAAPASPASRTSDWPAAHGVLAAEFPTAREGILYAVHRLRQDATLTLPDIRADAEAASVKIGGRSLHSARALLTGRQARAVPAASLADQVHHIVANVEREARKEARPVAGSHRGGGADPATRDRGVARRAILRCWWRRNGFAIRGGAQRRPLQPVAGCHRGSINQRLHQVRPAASTIR